MKHIISFLETAKLEQEVGVSFSTVNNWERGKRNPQPYLLKKLMELAEEPSTSK